MQAPREEDEDFLGDHPRYRQARLADAPALPYEIHGRTTPVDHLLLPGASPAEPAVDGPPTSMLPTLLARRSSTSTGALTVAWCLPMTH